MRERDPGRASTRADIDDRPSVARNELSPAERIVEQRAASLVEIADRRQSRRGDDSGEPGFRWA
jgi:hypothetical protein